MDRAGLRHQARPDSTILWPPPPPPQVPGGPETVVRPLSRHSCFSPQDLPAQVLPEDGIDAHNHKIITPYDVVL